MIIIEMITLRNKARNMIDVVSAMINLLSLAEKQKISLTIFMMFKNVVNITYF